MYLIEPEERFEASVDRKLKEVILAAELSRLYSKNQISRVVYQHQLLWQFSLWC